MIGQNLAKTGAGEDYSLLDIGCGEGFLLQYFHDKGKKVKGIDIGSYALEHYHPDMLPFFEKGEMEKEYWLDAPNQTRYFNRDGLIRLLEAQGFECADFYGDTFVDFQLINPFSNYYEKPETGKAAHGTIVRLQNMFHDISMERTVEIYRMLGDMGFGREIVGIFKKKQTDAV